MLCMPCSFSDGLHMHSMRQAAAVFGMHASALPYNLAALAEAVRADHAIETTLTN